MADPVWVDGTTPLNAVNMTKLQTRDEKGVANGYAQLDSGIHVPLALIPDLSATYQAKTEKAAANGYASLGADGKVPAAQLPAGVSYGTTLPASPVDGQEAILVPSLTTPFYFWRFRYNAGSTSAYKWEFIGGAGYFGNSTVADGGTATTWVKDTRTGLVVPRNGDYICRYTGWLTNTSGATALGALSIGTESGGGGLAPTATTSIDGGAYASMSVEKYVLNVVAGDTIRGWWYGQGAVFNLGDRALTITPYRVA